MTATLHLQVTAGDGTVVDERCAHNTVMASGARLIADLFAGTGSPITHMGVGTSDAAPDDVNVAALSNAADGDAAPLDGATLGAIPPAAFVATIVPERRVVQVRVRGTLPADAAIGRIREAGLVSQSDSGSVLYNRVVFPPVDKRDDHELTLFWEIEFPFGDLQWLS
ncbi:hypothetical protein FHX52_0800 [Humibacillus xanthopallidus]|uniref:SOUL heme-binding protein n=1 Tax=Humibacillus xanthopallidus TaxID=412689 RepID=A0A543PUD6_9MICO|nr:hypothetical protein [Humibacillus xanthopallidus]TQN47691.1 hypothetical protein FHX52_0800 [Humibacillus xanthopallidus]